jgi:hypothetical protein
MLRVVLAGFTCLALAFSSGCANPFYEPCDAAGLCPMDYVCADRETAPVCTTFCTTSDDCRRHGERAFCTRMGVCLVMCSRDEDCPPTAYCDLGTSTCLR